jgi:hypothetical protein
MMLVGVFVDEDDEDEYLFFPVLAIMAQRLLFFAAAPGDHPRESATAAGLEKAGWQFYDHKMEFDVLFTDPEGRVNSAWGFFVGLKDAGFRVVTTPWDPSEDEEALQEIVDELRVKIREGREAFKRELKEMAAADRHP